VHGAGERGMSTSLIADQAVHRESRSDLGSLPGRRQLVWLVQAGPDKGSCLVKLGPADTC